MKKIFLFLITFSCLTSCSFNKIVDVKSPCVSAEGGPCGPKMPVNDWWLKEYKIKS